MWNDIRRSTYSIQVVNSHVLSFPKPWIEEEAEIVNIEDSSPLFESTLEQQKGNGCQC